MAGEMHTALYSYSTQEAETLQFEAGDIMLVTGKANLFTLMGVLECTCLPNPVFLCPCVPVSLCGCPFPVPRPFCRSVECRHGVVTTTVPVAITATITVPVPVPMPVCEGMHARWRAASRPFSREQGSRLPGTDTHVCYVTAITKARVVVARWRGLVASGLCQCSEALLWPTRAQITRSW